MTAALVAAVAVAGPAAPAVAAPDRSDTAAAARRAAVERPGTWVREALPAGDVDWFRYRLASAVPVSVTLGGLPADYDLAVYDGTGRRRAVSTRTGRTFDEVWVRMPAGTVLVKVTRKRRAAAGTYSLRLRAFSPRVHTLSVRGTTTRGEVIGEFYNATGRWHAVSELTGLWLDRRGNVVRREVTFMSPNVWLRPWSRAPFTLSTGLTGPQEARTASIRVTPRLVTETTAPRLPALTARVTRTETYRFDDGTGQGVRQYYGIVSTTARTRVAGVRVYLCEYDANGTMQTLGLSDDTYTLPPRGRRAWRGNSYGSIAPPALVTVHAEQF